MKLHRIWAIILRFIFLFRHSFDRLSDVFYWPTIDLIIWGLTTHFLTTVAPNSSQIILAILSAYIFWVIVWRGQYEITVNLLEDLWNRNLVNIFVAPLKFSEWVVALIIEGVIKAAISFVFAGLVAFLMYKLKIIMFGWYILPFSLMLIMTGWWVGFLVAGLILRFGTKVQTLAWTIAWMLGPFSAIFYPVSSLPGWAQKISALIPISYVFEASREVVYKGQTDLSKLLLPLVLNVIYLIASLIFVRRSFDKVLEKGLVKVY